MGEQAAASGPDFSQGVSLAEVRLRGMLPGRVGDEPVLLARLEGELFAVGGACTHYGAPLAGGLVEGETVRCPLHHACFSLRTGAALRAPAFEGLEHWRVEIEGDVVLVREKLPEAGGPLPVEAPPDVRSIIIVGGGAAGFACADELRRSGYERDLTLLSADSDPPCDRPNLSKDYLAGTAPAEWISLRGEAWYRERRIDLRLNAEVVAIDGGRRQVETRGGEVFRFDRLLIATGSEPVRLAEAGFRSDKVRYLRSPADARAVAELARPGARVAILGSSFIGLEAAAALRARRLDVAIVSPDAVPFEQVLGREVGRFLQQLHERNGVAFHLGRIGTDYDGRCLRLDAGGSIEADFVLAGIGVRPRTALAAASGLDTSAGVVVNAMLETSVRGIFAAGDIAAYPDPISGRPIRIEHWVTAQRQGQTAAANMLGGRNAFRAVPFFWTEQFGVALRYIGHSVDWSEIRIDGDVGRGDFTARYFESGELCASASVGRDLENLEDERRLEERAAAQAKAPPRMSGTFAAA